MKDDDYIAGSDRREQQKRKPRPNAFLVGQKSMFLEHFAGSCNVRAACKHAGVAPSTVYRHRAKDPKFRQGWEDAQATGYAALEAELVRRGLEFVRDDVVPDEESAKTLAGMDARLILTILQQQHKKAGQGPGDIRPRRSDLKEATERLGKLLKRMKLEVEEADRRADGE